MKGFKQTITIHAPTVAGVNELSEAVFTWLDAYKDSGEGPAGFFAEPGEVAPSDEDFEDEDSEEG